MRRRFWASFVLAMSIGVLVGSAGQPASAAQSSDACTLTVGGVGYSAGMFYAPARLDGGCTGQVTVDLQLSTSTAGPFTIVESSATYPSNPGAPGGTAWFLDAYNTYGCGYFYRAVGTYGGLTDVSDSPRWPC